MNFIGKIAAVFTIEGRGNAIVTDLIMTFFDPSRFPSKTILELRNSKGSTKQFHIKSAELALRDGQDYLSYILEDANLDELRTFNEVWSLEPGAAANSHPR